MSDKKILRSASDLEQSRWADMVRDPKAMKIILKKTSDLLGRLGKGHPISARAKEALNLINNGCAGEMLSGRNLLILAAALAYFISPIDVIPDCIAVIGWLDDIYVINIALNAILPGRRKDEDAMDVNVVTSEAVDSIAAALPNNWEGSDVYRELEAMEKQVDELGDDTLRMRLEEARNIVADPLRRVVFAGGFSAGKSSLINRLLGVDILPVSPIPCTRALTTITYGEAPKIIVELKDGGYRESTDLSLLKDDAAMEEAKEITVLLPNEMLKRGLTLVDTCGLEYSDFDERAFSELPHAAALVFVKSLIIGGVNEAEARFCTDAINSLTSDHIIIALNKTDEIPEQHRAQAETEVRKFFVDKGLINIQTIPTCSLPEVTDAGVEALRAELIKRASSSMQSDHQRMVQEQFTLLGKLVNQGKAARAELARLSAEEQAKAKLQAAKYVEQRINHLEQLALKANNRFEAALHIFISENLLPNVTQLANRLPLNNQYASSITHMMRDSLATYIKKEVNDIAAYFDTEWKAYSENNIKIFTANLAPELPPMNDEMLNKIGRYLLPGASLAAFFTMSTVGWLLGPALPLLVLHKMGIGEKLVGLWKEFGSSAKTRTEFINAIKNEINNVERDICYSIRTEVISPIVEKQIESLRKSIV